MPTARQTLGFVEEKLRRVFNLAGPLGATLDPTVQPVVIVDDLRDPGHAFYQGRSWAQTIVVNNTGGAFFVAPVKFNDDVLIEAVYVVGQLQSILSLFIVTPDQWTTAPPGGLPVVTSINTGQAAWRDRNGQPGGSVTPQDLPPIESVAAWVAPGVGTVGPVSGNTLINLASGYVTVPAIFPMPIFVPRGGALCWELVGAATVGLTVGMWGRIWPQ